MKTKMSQKALKTMTNHQFMDMLLTDELKDRKPDSAVAVKLQECKTQVEQDALAKINYPTLSRIFRLWESVPQHGHLTAYITFTEKSLPVKGLPLKSRTYRVSSGNTAFAPASVCRTIYGACLDGTNEHCSLHLFMAAEGGGKNGWCVEYCQLIEEGV